MMIISLIELLHIFMFYEWISKSNQTLVINQLPNWLLAS